jgi:hypothetical protein
VLISGRRPPPFLNSRSFFGEFDPATHGGGKGTCLPHLLLPPPSAALLGTVFTMSKSAKGGRGLGGVNGLKERSWQSCAAPEVRPIAL